MINLFDPATADMIFTLSTSALVLGATALSLWMMPWTDADIEATEAAADQMLQATWAPARFRPSR